MCLVELISEVSRLGIEKVIGFSCGTALVLQGGYVDCCSGVWRIQGSLAVSRGIGDRSLKQWVIAEPETKILTIKPECEFLILGSDGLWDKVNIVSSSLRDLFRSIYMIVVVLILIMVCFFFLSLQVNNQEAVDLVSPLCVGVDKPEPSSACKKLVDLSIRRGSTDDISVMIVHLGHFIS